MNKRPLFLVHPRDQIVKKWILVFQKLEHQADELLFTVNPTIVAEGEVARIQQMVIALQHHPDLIERMIFAVKFKFMLVDDVGVELSEAEWKSRREVQRWFYAMSSLSPVIYFINDQDARDYFLFGDVLASGHFHCGPVRRCRHLVSEFTEEERQDIAGRLFHSSWSLLMYCHGTGFNPDLYIDALLADYDMPYTAADVRKKYEEDIKKGIHFGIVAEVK